MDGNPFGRRGRSAAAPYLGFAPGITLFVVFVLGPAVAIGYFALTDATGIPGVPIHYVGLHNFREFFDGPDSAEDMAIIKRSVIYAAAVTVVQSALALAVSLALNQRIRGRTAVRVIVFAPTVLGVTVTALIWQLSLDPTSGPAASLLGVFGVHSSFLGSDSLAFDLLIGVQIWSGLGFSMVIFLAGLQTVPGELHEAATVDGAGAWRRFRDVTWPLLAPSLTANVLIALIGSLQSYQLVYTLTGGQHHSSTLAFKVFSAGFGVATTNVAGNTVLNQQGYAAAISLIQFALITVIALVVLRYLRRREVQL